jgi:hypothetical protein
MIPTISHGQARQVARLWHPKIPLRQTGNLSAGLHDNAPVSSSATWPRYAQCSRDYRDQARAGLGSREGGCR